VNYYFANWDVHYFLVVTWGVYCSPWFSFVCQSYVYTRGTLFQIKQESLRSSRISSAAPPPPFKRFHIPSRSWRRPSWHFSWMSLRANAWILDLRFSRPRRCWSCSPRLLSGLNMQLDKLYTNV
jgi:hypothetical protein